MPNILDATGLTLATREEWVTYFTEKYQLIYGADINLESSTPDGQMMNIMIQVILDLQDLVATVYNGFDPDNATGVVLDQRVTINGIQRQAGTFTITPVTIVNSQSVNLYGLDQDIEDVYTVADNAGTEWKLIESELGLSAGSHALDFRAAVPGEQLTTPNTITVPVTIVLGVTSINNPSSYTTLGINEETDAQLRVRRLQSVSLASQGYLEGLLSALLNIDGMASAFVYENTTDATDSDGVPSHSIWVITAGTADPAEIAQAIYTKRNAGCGMHGDETYAVTQVDSSVFIIRWDNVITRNVFIRFTATSIDAIIPPDIDAIRTGIVTAFIPEVNADVDINGLATVVQEIDPNCLVTNAGFSLGEEQTLTLSGVAASGAFVIEYNGDSSASIDWNDSAGTIETKIQAVTGLANTTVTGSIASMELVFDLSGESDVTALLTVTTNTLETAGTDPITFDYDADYQEVLTSPTKQNQLLVSVPNIIILEMQLTPFTSSVDAMGSQQFFGYGGYGDYVYSIEVDTSGASIDSATGEYTAGAVLGTDTIKVTDAFGNEATTQVSVV